MTGTLVLNVALNAALTPVCGAVNVACAAAVGELLLAAALLRLVVREARLSRRAERAMVGAA
ncbi:MAG TPA: hypothetical protein VFM14_03085 [Gemmatimonadales bacterium]|nr:hypothetical protein [Gemmatimonadales bacterium]